MWPERSSLDLRKCIQEIPPQKPSPKPNKQELQRQIRPGLDHLPDGLDQEIVAFAKTISAEQRDKKVSTGHTQSSASGFAGRDSAALWFGLRSACGRALQFVCCPQEIGRDAWVDNPGRNRYRQISLFPQAVRRVGIKDGRRGLGQARHVFAKE